MQNPKPHLPDDLKPYRLFGLTTIQLMLIIAVFGVVLTLILQHYFPELAAR